jgi:VCBS repeat protein/FG-GAP repeat protein
MAYAFSAIAILLACLLNTARAGAPAFKKLVLNDTFLSEGANVGDFNHDGKMDVVSGPYWYEGPELTQRHEYYPAQPIDPHGYSKAFFAFTDDFDHDGWTDILIISFPGEDASWFQNPHGAGGMWKKHLAFKTVDDESPGYQDITGDGQRELICITGGQFGYATPNRAHPDDPWTFHAISPKGPWQRFTHGLGVGDVNADGRMDLLEASGWWEQPASLIGDPVWPKHDTSFGDGGAQMYAADVTGDRKPDVITSLQAHGYGLAWFEQTAGGQFEQHLIIGSTKQQSAGGVVFSEPHAVAVADIDGDGLMDIVTGKRFWAHGPNGPDPDSNGPAVLYWFQQTRDTNGTRFIPHQIDDNSGVGTQVIAADVNGDGAPDIVVGNKKGTFVFLQLRSRTGAQPQK